MTLTQDHVTAFVYRGLELDDDERLPGALVELGDKLHDEGKRCHGLVDGAGLCEDCGKQLLLNHDPSGCLFAPLAAIGRLAQRVGARLRRYHVPRLLGERA